MAQEDYVAIKSDQLSQAAGEERYIIVNRWTREVVDNCNDHGYKSAQSAHKSWSFKQKKRSQGSGNLSNGGTRQGGFRSGYRTAVQRPLDVSQENTPPPPGLFDFENK